MYPTIEVVEHAGKLALGLFGGAVVVVVGVGVIGWLVITVISHIASWIVERNAKPKRAEEQ